MSAVAEKQTKTAAVARRVPVRPPLALWSAPSGGEQRALRAIVAAPCPAAPVRRACAACEDEQVQRAVTVGPADDEYEREADAMAEAVMRAPALDAAPPDPPPAAAPPPVLPAQRACAACEENELQRDALEEDDEERVQREIAVGPADDEYEREADTMADRVMRLSAAGREGGEIDDADLTARLRAPGSGRPLAEGTRALIEPRLGYDFSQVRVHDSAEERQDAARLNARAFTYGRHIWIGPGESADNPRLMAHELTHVVQQGAAQPVVQREEGDEGGIGAAIWGAVADTGWGLVRLVAPGLEAHLRPIIERGPLGFLQDQLASVFDGLVGALTALLPQGALDTLATLFDELVARAEPIVAALRAGDCEPLFRAIDELKTFVTDIATGAWDKLVEFVSPVGEFFTGLWSGYGAPAIEWLQNFAGDVWAAIQQLAADIWDWTAPVRNAVTGAFSSAWGWVKDQLGLGDDPGGDSEGGVVAWIQGLATQAWDWFKDQTRPVWQPVVALAEEINALIPPPFVRRLGEQFSDLGASLNRVNEETGGGDDVAANREALAAALPTLEEVIEGVRGVIVTAGDWLGEKVDLVTGGFGALLARLRGHSLLAPLGDALSWLDEAGQSMSRWAHGQVSQLFGFLLGAFDFLAPFVRRLVTTVQSVIEVAADIMQLPAMVLNTVWNLIPACIRDPIKDFVINQILRRIPVFSTLLELPDIWARIEATALRILRQVFVDGDLARAAWTFFSSMLEVIGIPPQLVVSILAKAATAIGDILGNPVGFLLNLLSAIKEGFIRFFGNIGTHLLGGITGWLFGQLSAGGLRPPADFSLREILGFVLQVLDITVDRVFERLARRLDPVIVQRLRQALEIATGVWRFVAILIEEGPAGLWAEIQDQLAGLWDRVLDGVIGWLTRTIITRVSVRLLTMLDPTGVMAAVNSAIALYRAIESAIQYIREMLMVIDRVLDGIGGIARGAIDIAAGFFETALASGIPMAIGFLANQIGLSNFGERIQEMVESVREMVDRAIDWVIDRAIAAGQALINMLRRGVAAVRDWLGLRKQFTSPQGEPHTLFFEGSGANARLMIASEEQSYQEFITNITVAPDKQAAKEDALLIADRLDEAVAAAATLGSAGAAGGTGTDAGAVGEDPSAEITGLLDELATATAEFIPAGSGESSEPVYGPPVNGFGSSVQIAQLTSGHGDGSSPSIEGGDWEALRRRQSGAATYYVRGHLLNEQLGGPGGEWSNLTPITRSANALMSARFETPVKNAVAAGRKVHFQVTAHYGGYSHPLAGDELDDIAKEDEREAIAAIIRVEQTLPTSIECEAEALIDDTHPAPEAIVPEGGPISNEFDDQQVNLYHLTPAPAQLFYVDQWAAAGRAEGAAGEEGRTQLRRLAGVDEPMARAIIAARPAGGYRRSANLRAIPGLDWDSAAHTPGLRVRLYERGG